MVAETDAPALSFEELLAEQPSEATQADRMAAAEAAEAARAQLQAAREAVRPFLASTLVQSPFCMKGTAAGGVPARYLVALHLVTSRV